MNQRKRQPKSNKSNQKHSLVREYAPPVLKKISKPWTDITLFANVNVDSGATGLNGIYYNISWAQFSDIAEFLGVYKYCEITGYKFDFNQSGTRQAALDGTAVALRSINYLTGEQPTSTVPSGGINVLDLPGSIFCQTGASNRGQWVPPQCKQVYSFRDVITNVRPIFDLVCYADNVGISERVGVAYISLNLRIYGKEYSGTL